MILFITYGNHKFERSKYRLAHQIKNIGYDVKVFGPENLDTTFQNRFPSILKQSRIGGYGIWRPYIIKRELEQLQEGDFLIYLDAGCTINPKGLTRLNEYFDLLQKSEYGIISFEIPHKEELWTTNEVFDYFNADKDIQKSNQIMDTVLIMKKCSHLEKIIDVWFKTVYDWPEMFTDCYNSNQPSCFKDHRHEQSVLSVIRKIYGSLVLDDETYFTPFGSQKSLKYPFWATRIKA